MVALADRLSETLPRKPSEVALRVTPYGGFFCDRTLEQIQRIPKVAIPQEVFKTILERIGRPRLPVAAAE